MFLDVLKWLTSNLDMKIMTRSQLGLIVINIYCTMSHHQNTGTINPLSPRRSNGLLFEFCSAKPEPASFKRKRHNDNTIFKPPKVNFYGF
ncbi:MAG: hypothetical protein DRR08_03780 [Candidatus Parabeggiatoa sp. nov. 2]|nr:MAG: hypothetical protein B6247_08470 [Beggiatoa sp. 4572_84]RKZ63322.1 MAG: hypothetical protein DRR08_03780 [Gammaproteobacteria bacterium]